jgi:hypothetical protein
VFGRDKLSYISVNNTDFVVKEVSQTIGCIAPEAVVELNTDLVFLSQDGFRTIAGTERFDDLNLGLLSKPVTPLVKELLSSGQLDYIRGVIIRSKPQARFFFNKTGATAPETRSLMLGIRDGGQDQQTVSYEWSELIGIQASAVACACSDYIVTGETIVHGDENGIVYKQDSGETFDGDLISFVYQTPFLDLGESFIRKSFRKIQLFVSSIEALELSLFIRYDWDQPNYKNPSNFFLSSTQEGLSLYGASTSLYDDSGTLYASDVFPVIEKDITGSGRSISFIFTSNTTTPQFSLQNIGFEFTPRARS